MASPSPTSAMGRVGSLDFHPWQVIMRLPSLPHHPLAPPLAPQGRPPGELDAPFPPPPHWGGVRRDPVESQDFSHSRFCTEPPWLTCRCSIGGIIKDRETWDFKNVAISEGRLGGSVA